MKEKKKREKERLLNRIISIIFLDLREISCDYYDEKRIFEKMKKEKRNFLLFRVFFRFVF